MDWFAVYTQPQKERVAEHHLRRQGFQTYLPQFLKTRRHARKVEEVAAPLFPRYLFAAMTPENARWRAVNGTVGVVNVVMQADRPASLPARILEEIRDQENDAGFLSWDKVVRFCQGQTLAIKEGLFATQTGTFAGWNDRERIYVLLNLLGQQQRVVLPAQWVEAA